MVQNRDSNIISSTELRTGDIQPMISEKQENVCALHLDLRDLNCFPQRRSRVRSVSMVKESADFSFGTHTTYPRSMRARSLDRPMGMAQTMSPQKPENFIFLSPLVLVKFQWSNRGGRVIKAGLCQVLGRAMIGSWWRKNVIEKVHAAAYSGKFTINNPIAYKFVQVCLSSLRRGMGRGD